MKDPLRKLIEAWEPRLSRAFRTAIRAMRDQVVLSELVQRIKAGDIEGAIRLVGLDPAKFRALDKALSDFFEAAGHDITLSIKPQAGPLGLRIAPLFDVRAPSADGWIRNRTGELITQITDDQRALVRQALAPLRSGIDPMLTGDTPQKLALDLVGRVSRETGSREGGLIGLTSQQAEWARNYAQEIAGDTPSAAALTRKLRDKRFDRTVARAIRDGEPISADLQEKMAAAYRNRALRYRAETIAKAEADAVAIQAQQEAWDQAVARGSVAESALRRFWLTAGDDHVRPTHRAVPGMNKAGVRLNEPFETPKGPTMQPGWSFDPGCRCRVRIRVVEESREPSPSPLRQPALVLG